MPTPPAPTPSTVLCDIHGLRYDPNLADGCARCRADADARIGRRSFVLASVGAVVLGGAAWLARRPSAPSAAAAPDAVAANAPAPAPRDISYGGTGAGALFVPTSTQPMPVILLFDPSGDAMGIVRRYMPAASERGWILASSSNVMNGTADAADTEQMMNLLTYVRTQATVDERRLYTAGMSGGACGAYRLAIVAADVFSGAIVECGHMGSWREVGHRAVAGQSFYLFTRDEDFNLPATRQLQGVMLAAGCRVALTQRPGGHAPMEPNEVEAALQWLAAG